VFRKKYLKCKVNAKSATHRTQRRRRWWEPRPAPLAQREAARKAEQARVMKEQAEQMRVAQAKRQDILKNSPVNSFMFCESSSPFLLGPGEPITSLLYQCDLLASG
jgi:hypothetical protein